MALTSEAPKSIEDARAKKEKAASEIVELLQLDIDFKVSAAYRARLREMLLSNLNRMSWEALDWFRFALLNDLSNASARDRATRKLLEAS